MESLNELKSNSITPKEWLTYYKNIWTRNCIARAIDVQNDRNLKSKNPEERVISDDQTKMITVKERLENRKILVQDALDVVSAIEVMLKTIEDPNVDFYTAFFSKEALAIDEDMLPKKEEEKKDAPIESPKEYQGDKPEGETPKEENKQ